MDVETLTQLLAEKYEFMRPIVEGWRARAKEAETARANYDAVAKQCTDFFCGAIGFMYEPEYQKKYMGGRVTPRFKITMAKAFELVALFGPILYWRNPQRMLRPIRGLELSPEMFGDPNDPRVQQLMQQAVQQQASDFAKDNAICQLMQSYLNYSPLEQPGGGLAAHSEMAITQALVTGRGVQWVETYSPPGSQQVLTGCFFDDQKNLLIDPDATCLQDALWVARKRVEPYWQVEKKFKLPKDSLKRYATMEGSNAQAEVRASAFGRNDRAQGKTNDLLPYTEFYSKMGIGARIKGVETPLKDAFDQAVGEYAYIVIGEGVPFPLNGSTDAVLRATDDEVGRMFRWPIPFWLDNMWPFAELDFYRKWMEPYPIPPLAPGLGELSYLNLFISHLAGRVWSSSRDFIAVLESAMKYVEPVLKGGEDMAIMKIPAVHQQMDKIIHFLQQPEVRRDAWEIVDRITMQFEKRVGLKDRKSTRLNSSHT